MKQRIKTTGKSPKRPVCLYLSRDVLVSAQKLAEMDRRSVSGVFEQLVLNEFQRIKSRVKSSDA